MKKMLKMAVVLMGLITLTACPKNEKKAETQEAAVDAVEKDLWHYYSLSAKQEVGTGKEDSTDNALWFSRTDWDLAISRYFIRTNSGLSTTQNAQGGVYTFAENVTFDAAVLPSGAVFATDKAVTTTGMGGTTTTMKSEATVVRFQTDAEGNMIMPPQYLKAPIYAFRSADGRSCYKVEFTQYKDEAGESGHVRFYYQKLD